jgi:peptidoglycan hydrolase-like protein with peptidoglycan-binding domain
MGRRTVSIVGAPLLAGALLAVAALVVLSTSSGAVPVVFGPDGPPAAAGDTGSDESPTEAPPGREVPSVRTTEATAGDALPAPVKGVATQRIRPALSLGDSGDDVALFQEILHELGYDPGPVDGYFRTPTLHAVYAFQKVQGRAPTGEVTPETWRDAGSPVLPEPLVPDGAPNRVEIDLARQLLFLYEDGELTLTTHVSSGTGREFCTDLGGCRNAVTPEGDFTITRRIDGWRQSELGLLYNPQYFIGGVAIHGSYHIPTRPASFGCVRIPMHISEYFPERISIGDPVHVRG